MDNKTIPQIIEEVCNDICNHYCKYPGIVRNEEELSEECYECPLNKLH